MNPAWIAFAIFGPLSAAVVAIVGLSFKYARTLDQAEHKNQEESHSSVPLWPYNVDVCPICGAIARERTRSTGAKGPEAPSSCALSFCPASTILHLHVRCQSCGADYSMKPAKEPSP
jgi:hypothetical protein